MSLGAWQRNAGVHFPPWQFVEQQSLPTVQASSSVLHALVPLGAGSAWQVVEQLPVQHSPPDAQAVPVVLQVVFAHRPPTQDCEQHSLGFAQAAPGDWQKAVVVQVPAFVACVGLLQAVEQQSPLSVQATPVPPQVETGAAHWWLTGLQYPSQQAESEVQLNPISLQIGAVAQNFVGSQ